jgi:voltage-gated potassium channel
MLFLRQACAAIVLVMLTLGMQSAGMASLIEWAKSHFAKGAQAFGPLGSAVLVVRFTALIICLHILEILLWTAFYRWRCLSTWESAFYFSATSYSTVGYRDVVLQPVWRLLGPRRKYCGCAHVRTVGELPVCSCDPAHREQRISQEPSVRLG